MIRFQNHHLLADLLVFFTTHKGEKCVRSANSAGVCKCVRVFVSSCVSVYSCFVVKLHSSYDHYGLYSAFVSSPTFAITADPPDPSKGCMPRSVATGCY